MKLYKYLNHLDSLILAITGFYAIHLFTAYSGVGISPDSIMYASTATNIQNHLSLITFNNTPLVFFPVFFPVFLGIIQFFSGINPIQAGAYINQFLFAAVIFLSGFVITKFIPTYRIYKIIILIVIILSPGLLEVYSYLWSETLFIFEILLFVILFGNYLKSSSKKNFVLICLITAIACITRYAGVTLIGAGCLILLINNQSTLKAKLLNSFIFGLASISLLIVNLILNRLSTGLSTGTREPSITPFSKNLYYIGTVLCDWGSLGKESYPFAIYLTCFIILFLVSYLGYKLHKKQLNNYEAVAIIFSLVYILFILITATFSRFERVNSRILSPIIIPLILSCTCWVPEIISKSKSDYKYAFATISTVLILIFSYSTYQVDWQRYDDESDYGVPGYSDDDWNKSDFVTYLKKHKSIFKPNIPVYTDANEAVYLFTGMHSELLPHKFFKNDVKKFFAKQHFYLIWFDNLSNTEILNLDEIKKVKNLILIGKAKEGEIYYCDSKK